MEIELMAPADLAPTFPSGSCVIEAAYLDAAIQALQDTFDIPFFDVKKRLRDY